MRRWLAAAALLLAGHAAQAAIVFTPHVSEYAPLARGVYVDTSLDYTHLTHAWNADGERIRLRDIARIVDQQPLLLHRIRRHLFQMLFADADIPQARLQAKSFR